MSTGKVTPKRKRPTPEQKRERERVDKRNAALQEKGVPHPIGTSGIFGGKPSERK